MNIQAVLFDADGVLQNPVEGGREKLASLCGSAVRKDEFLVDFLRSEMPCLKGEADFAVTVAEVLKKWDSPFSVEQAIETHTKIVAMNLESLEVVRAYLRRSGVGAYLATNQHEYRARYMSEVFGYADIFDGEFYSCRDEEWEQRESDILQKPNLNQFPNPRACCLRQCRCGILLQRGSKRVGWNESYKKASRP